MVVRIFARHLAALDPATEVPPEDMLPHRYRRIAPYLYSPGEITALMAAAGRDLADADRLAGGDRHAQVRGLPPGSRPG